MVLGMKTYGFDMAFAVETHAFDTGLQALQAQVQWGVLTGSIIILRQARSLGGADVRAGRGTQP